jgi:hypothetical protein
MAERSPLFLSKFVCSIDVVQQLKRKKGNVRRSLFVLFVLGVISLSARSAEAQEGRWQEISAQGTGFFTKNSSGDGIQQHSSDTGGFVLSYRYHFTRWLAADASYGFARNTQESNLALTTLRVQANVHQATAALVVTIPRRVLKLNPLSSGGHRCSRL